MSKENQKGERETGQIPLDSTVCSFKGARSEVMKRVWKAADQLEEKGYPLDYGSFGYLIRKKWAEIKEEQKQKCRPLSEEELETLLKRIEETT